MTRDAIKQHFENKGYKLTYCMSGRVVVEPKFGFGKVFNSCAEAHKYYFRY